MNEMGDYHDIYSKTDVLVLADILLLFRKLWSTPLSLVIELD